MSLSIREYSKNECITFKSTKGTYGALSNMSPNFPIFIRGIMIPTSEALYQAFRFTQYPEIQKEIIRQHSPISAKKIGRNNIEYSRQDWDKIRFEIMRFCLSVKLYQNYETFSEILLKTDKKSIVEFTETDKVWGAVLEGSLYKGTNALGRLLMELREKISMNNYKLHIPDMPNMLFLGEKIDIKSLDFNLKHPKLF